MGGVRRDRQGKCLRENIKGDEFLSLANDEGIPIKYPQVIFFKKNRNGKKPQWKKSMGIKTTIYSKTA